MSFCAFQIESELLSTYIREPDYGLPKIVTLCFSSVIFGQSTGNDK